MIRENTIVCQIQAAVAFRHYLGACMFVDVIFNNEAIQIKKQTAQNSELSFKEVMVGSQFWKIIKQL